MDAFEIFPSTYKICIFTCSVQSYLHCWMLTYMHLRRSKANRWLKTCWNSSLLCHIFLTHSSPQDSLCVTWDRCESATASNRLLTPRLPLSHPPTSLNQKRLVCYIPVPLNNPATLPTRSRDKHAWPQPSWMTSLPHVCPQAWCASLGSSV